MDHRRTPWVLGIALSLLAVIQALHRANQGRGAFLGWESHLGAFWSGGELYGTAAEGYPTLPITLLLMAPFHGLGAVPGALVWALFKIGLAWWIVTRAFELAGAGGGSISAIGKVSVIVLAFRPLLSDVTHGNLNLLVGAVFVAAAWAWSRGRDMQAGAWLGLGAIMKVTPALGLIFFLYKRSGRGVAGMALGGLAALLVPALAVGWERNLSWVWSWWDQMIAPYLAAGTLSLRQTEHINQSLLGVMARWLTDSVAIPASPEHSGEAVTIHIVALGRETFRSAHLAACLATVAFMTWCFAPPGRPRRDRTVLAEFALLSLAMLFLSERSWKHHYILLALPLSFLVLQLQLPRGDAGFRRALIGLVAVALSIGATGSGWLGSYGSDLAEAYGSFLLGGLVLFVTVGVALRAELGLPDGALEPPAGSP